MVDSGTAAIIGSMVALILGLISVLNSNRIQRTSAARERAARRAEGFVELLRLVERRGLAVQDRIYNLTETTEDDDPFTIAPRDIDEPPRTDRAEMRALIAAYGSLATRAAFRNWLLAVDAWESKEQAWGIDWELSGPRTFSRESAEPERSAELLARDALGAAVSEMLVDL
jgi:hypothetical protein